MQLNGLQVFKNLLAPANEVCEGYVFTGVCLSTGGGSPSGGGLCPGEEVSVRETPQTETPRTVMSRRYASYWNAFLFLASI